MDKFYQFIIEQRKKHMEERDTPEVGKCSFIGKQAVGGFPAHTESKESRGTGSKSIPRLQFPMPDLQLVRLDHAPALLAFERENRAYFAAGIPDRAESRWAGTGHSGGAQGARARRHKVRTHQTTREGHTGQSGLAQGA